MRTGSIGPGTLLAGRYRLEDLLAESGGARFWRATDTVLARSVAIHAVPSDDPRAPGLLDAARVSATITDPHLLRVLDCDDDDGITWVVNEWGEGISLDLMLQQGTLPPSRAAWLTREVAEAIAAGHAQGVAHGRLNPEAVLVTHAGAVKLIGYVVDASLESPRPPDPLYGELDEREADVINLAGILYAALTGRWPGVARSAVPKAPRESRRPLRPRQVRAGVPRTLDAICERVLHKEASRHAMPIETAHEIAAALADYVGDPALSAPLDAAGMHAEPTVSLHRDSLPAAFPDLSAPGSAEIDPPDTASGTTGSADTGSADAGSDATGTVETESADAGADGTGTVAVPAPPGGALAPEADDDADETTDKSQTPGGDAGADPESTQIAAPPVAADPGTDPGADPGTDPGTDPGAEPGADPDATQTFRPADKGADAPPRRTRSDQHSPLPPFPDLPERPLFAPTERRVPASARAQPTSSSGWAQHDPGTASGPDGGLTGNGPGTGTQPPVHDTPGGSSPAFWPFEAAPEDEHEQHTGQEGRGWLRMAIVIAVLLVLVVAMAISFNRGRRDAATPTGSGDSSSSAAQADGAALKPAGVTDFDPMGDPPEENPETAKNAIDGDPGTTWQTMTYRGNPALGGLKSGVGLIVDLGSDQEPASLTVQFKGAPTSFEVYAAPAGVTETPTGLDQLDKVGASADAPEEATVELDPAPKTRYLLVWLTKLPKVSGGYRGEISDISVRS